MHSLTGQFLYGNATVGSNNSSLTSFAMNTAGYMAGFGYVPAKDETVNEVSMYITAVTGTLGNGADCVCSVHALDSSGSTPAASAIESRSLGATPTANSLQTWTGFTSTLSAGQMYFFILSNPNAAAGNTYSVGYLPSALQPYIGIWNAAGSHFTRYTTSWANQFSSPGGVLLLKFSDGMYSGYPWQSANYEISRYVTATNKWGCELETPDDVILNVIGVTVQARYGSAASADNIVVDLMQGYNLKARSLPIPARMWTATQSHFQFYFTRQVQIYPKTTLQAVMAAESGTLSGNIAGAFMARISGIPAALVPANGTMKRISYNGSAWASEPLHVPNMALILDPEEPFVPFPLNRRQFNSMR